ncbi:SusC/RagA family TonB-linked outer membrane protein [Algibacter amylolyticus]|uniref:SusC/RagA family TonB-linked outer membrane protein n=1 Tax=Algibacter amylolyticus TaxID=1608400 RepID=A0A5M7BIF8_9FLAO|nr:SusC/RagA family TonB-linked outer membrane protein [Algibacter amylolyticus]KAA5827977.1 SusC/RagA family TonB-linked outer membrane protein [Algibacter amylolyticus]MBB5267216.1 TonB-linked SusC/RagA family outer membrane protein [Algibacter amylolyticus]TSJ82222.1 SusC/RagA family TonB-linked outer membrane protein [Algibacter amylolyticus]
MNIKLLFRKSIKLCCTVFLFLGVLMGNKMYAQDKTIPISGTITDQSGQPIPGVNILEQGTTNGTVTDFDGKYAFKVASKNSVLVISYVGFETQIINVEGKSVIDISLSDDLAALDEVVVVGYGSVKKKDLTGAVNTISASDVTDRNVTSPLEAIQGNVPGVQISSSTGRIGDGFDITIRGSNSLLSNTGPLYVVDGVPTDDISFLNPQDISRMDILKDASSAAIYGSRGASGVVIITTKSGSTAKSGMNVSYDTSYGTKEVARLPKMMSGDKWWYYHESAYLATTNGGNNDTTTPEMLQASVIGTANAVLAQRVAENNTFDWYDAVLESGQQTNNYLNISGRADNGLGYNLGLGLQTETGNIPNESIDKYTLKAGLNHKFNEKFATGVNVTIARTDEELGSDVAMREAFRLNPFLSPWAVDDNGDEIIGEYFEQPGKLTTPSDPNSFVINKTSTYNPLLEIANSSDQIKKWRTLANVFFEYKPLEWLTLKTTYSGNYNNNRRGKYWGILTNTGISNQNLASSEIANSQNFNYTWDNQFNINYTVKEDHVFNFLGLQSIFSNETESSFLSSLRQPFETGFHNVGSGDSGTYNLGSNYIKKTLNSYAVRLNYAFKDKYLLTVSNRWDGSSVLSEGNKWESFPSVSAAWKINEESFLSDSNTISSLKLRASLGYTGNDSVDAYSTLNGLNQQRYYDFNGTNANGWLAATLANSELTWEKTRELNFGLDFGLLNNRITGSLDVYDRLSEDLIYQQTLPYESGWESTFANVGSVSNKGVEVLLSTKNIKTDNISWETTFTFTKNTNKLESIYGQSEVSDIGNNLHLGESLNSYYNYVFDGIWQPEEEAEAASYGQTPGQAKVKDLNGDGEINANDDRRIIGNSDPSWSGAITSNLRVGNFDFAISAFTNQGVLAFSEFHQNFTDVRDRGRQKLDIADWYIPENGAGVPAQYSNSYPQPRNGGTYWRNDKVGYYRDASFIKIKNITLGYTLGDNIIDKLKMKRCRIYANVLNPFVISDYDGYDPEWAAAGYNIARVSSITYQLGLSLTF